MMCMTLGHRVEEASPPGSWDELSYALWVLVASNVSLAVRRRAEQLGRELKPDIVDLVTWDAVAFSATLDIEAYPAAVQSIHRQSRLMAAFHQTYDLLLSPTLAKPPVPVGTLRTDNPDLDAYRQALVEFMPFTQLFNMTGQPSMTVPLHWSEAGLPIGVMLSAPFGDEAASFAGCQSESFSPRSTSSICWRSSSKGTLNSTNALTSRCRARMPSPGAVIILRWPVPTARVLRLNSPASLSPAKFRFPDHEMERPKQRLSAFR